jgi:hypothetical protein
MRPLLKSHIAVVENEEEFPYSVSVMIVAVNSQVIPKEVIY